MSSVLDDAIERYGAFERIATFLVALAVVAERAAGRSIPVRCFVLWLLRPAETVARAFAVESGCPPFVVAETPDVCPRNCRSGDGPDDALRLAQRFRLLAAVFYALSAHALDWTSQARQPGLSCPSRAQPNASRLPPLLVIAPPRYADTS